jgi:hypothetical protein
VHHAGVAALDIVFNPISSTNRYTYVWKTDKSWSGTCRQLAVTLSDGTTHVAGFKFK